ncbi:MAG: VOC family protein [Candidatus Omnitrophota bacterium]
MQKITPFLWYNEKAGEATHFYASIFKDSKILSETADTDGTIMATTFQLNGQEFIAVNGGPGFTFNDTISVMVSVENQHEIDEFWEKLSEEGKKGQQGCLKDKYGLSWQIVPSQLDAWMNDPDAEKSKRVLATMRKMDKPDIETLKQAYEGTLINPMLKSG